MSWNKLDIKVPDVGTGTLTDIIQNIKDAVSVLTSILETILNVVPSFTDPLAALLKALIDELKSVVEGFLEDYGAYSLFVPVGRKLQTNFYGLGNIEPSWAGELGIFGGDTSQVDPANPELNEFLVQANRYNGGNAGFFKTVVDSLYDEGDPNRPQFIDDEDYVGGMVLLLGTEFDVLGLLDDMWTLNGVFTGPDTTPKTPRPKNLKARTIEGVSNEQFSALLTWDAPETPIWALPDLGGMVLMPERYAVFRGKNTTQVLTAANVVDLMGKRDVSVGDVFLDGQMEVIHESEYDITVASYLDEDIPTGPDDAFYYAVAWKLKAYGANEPITENTGKELDYWQISNIARVVPYPTLPASTPPDWRRTSSVADLFPAFASLLRKLVAQIEAFSTKLTSPADALRNYVDFLKNEILRYESIVNSILDDVARMKSLFKLPQAGVYVRTFKGRGGNDFFITDMANSFLPSEPTRPPFDRGTEYVTGVVIMTGGPKPAVDGLITGLEWIFGTASTTSEQAEMYEQLGKALDDVEDAFFGDDMQEEEPPAETTPPPEFDLALNPLSKREEEVEPARFGPNMEVL